MSKGTSFSDYVNGPATRCALADKRKWRVTGWAELLGARGGPVYPEEVKREVGLLADEVGAAEASRRTGIRANTLREWMAGRAKRIRKREPAIERG